MGGAISCGDGPVTVNRCIFIENTGGAGGAICAEGPAVITDCLFLRNSVKHAEHGGRGGAIASLGAFPPLVINCIFSDNTSENQGGGAYVGKNCAATFLHCTFSGNHADSGSGFFLNDSGSVTLTNTLVTFGDTGAAFDGSGQVTLDHCDVFGNQGGDWSGPIQNQAGDPDNLCADPLYVDAAADDLHLRFVSPCRDAGDAAAPDLPEKDWEGDPRPMGGPVDMGADEFHPHLYPVGDAKPGLEVDVMIVGVPGKKLMLCLSSECLDVPKSTEYGDWYLQPPIVPFLFGPNGFSGISKIRIRIPPNQSVPSTVPLQAFVRDELTNLMLLEIR